MSFLCGLLGTPQVGDKGVGNISANRTQRVEILTFGAPVWDTAWKYWFYPPIIQSRKLAFTCQKGWLSTS
jgi:hypothetical protein